MKRVIFKESMVRGKDKYVLRQEYLDAGIYQRMCPNGMFVSQDYLLYDEEKDITIISGSYNDICMEELLDAIDNERVHGKYGLKVFDKSYGYVIHPSGDKEI